MKRATEPSTMIEAIPAGTMKSVIGGAPPSRSYQRSFEMPLPDGSRQSAVPGRSTTITWPDGNWTEMSNPVKSPEGFIQRFGTFRFGKPGQPSRVSTME